MTCSSFFVSGWRQMDSLVVKTLFWASVFWSLDLAWRESLKRLGDPSGVRAVFLSGLGSSAQKPWQTGISVGLMLQAAMHKCPLLLTHALWMRWRAHLPWACPSFTWKWGTVSWALLWPEMSVATEVKHSYMIGDVQGEVCWGPQAIINWNTCNNYLLVTDMLQEFFSRCGGCVFLMTFLQHWIKLMTD